MQRSVLPRASARVVLSLLLATTFIAASLGPSRADAPRVASPDAPQISNTEGAAEVVRARTASRNYETSDLPARFRTTAAGERWHESGVDAGPTINCLHGYGESLGRSWVGWYGEVGATPTAGQVYYTKIGWGVAGNPCGGGAYVHIEEFLPTGTQLAISGQNPVMCWYEGLDADDDMARETKICPQAPQAGVQGGYSFDPSDGSGGWPTATGAIWEIWIPVKSSQPLDGLLRNPCNTCVQAGVWMIDGVNGPWSYPKNPVYVKGSSGGGTTGPSASYPAPSVKNETCCNAQGNAEADLFSWIFTQGNPGATQLQLSESAGAPYEDNFDYNITSTDIQSWGQNIELKWRLFFAPDTTYYWRMCFTPNGGTRVCGSEQSFRVNGPPDTVPPQTSIVDKPKKFTNKRTASFSLASTELPAKYECQLDGSPFSACMNPTFEKLSEGKHTFSAFATDEDGNSDLTPASYTWTVDLTKPKTTITDAPPSKTSKRSATFEFKSNENKSTFQCKLDSGGWKSCASGKTYVGLSRKQHTFSVRAKDRAGNFDKTAATKTWTVTK